MAFLAFQPSVIDTDVLGLGIDLTVSNKTSYLWCMCAEPTVGDTERKSTILESNRRWGHANSWRSPLLIRISNSRSSKTSWLWSNYTRVGDGIPDIRWILLGPHCWLEALIGRWKFSPLQLAPRRGSKFSQSRCTLRMVLTEYNFKVQTRSAMF